MNTKVAAIVLLIGGMMAVESRGEVDIGPYLSVQSQNGKIGGGGGLKGEWWLAENVGIEARGGYLTGDGDSATSIETGVLGRYPLANKIQLYGGVGGGYYTYSVESVSDITGHKLGDPDPVIGFYGVIGLRFAVSDRVSLFAEAKYTQAKFKQEDTGVLRSPTSGRVYGTYTTSREGGFDGPGGNAGILCTF